MRKKARETHLNPLQAEIALTGLHATGDFKVLRRMNLEQDNRLTRKALPNARIGICLDTETTGLNHARDRIIERYSGFEDPGFPLPKEIIEITGISDEMVQGQSFDEEKVTSFAERATLVIAHNAAFDRKFVEARFPVFSRLPWACSFCQIDWQAERISTRVLEYLLYKFGWFINAHRALDDAEGVLSLLLEKLPLSNTPVFKALLDVYEKETSTICAVGAPFEKKDLLKQRGYRWNDGSQGSCKSWWISLPSEREQDELSWLEDQVYPHSLPDSIEITRVNAFDRFSVRERLTSRECL